MNLGTLEIIVIACLLIILYGKRLPEVTRALGKGLRQMKQSMDEIKEDITQTVRDEDKENKEKQPEKKLPADNGKGMAG